MYVRTASLFITLLFWIQVTSCGQLLPPDAQSLALGGAVNSLQGISGLFYNPAAPAPGQTEWQAGLIFPYPGTGLKGLAAGMYFSAGEFQTGASIQLVGDDIYQYAITQALISRTWGSFRTGLRTEWHREAFIDRGSFSECYITAGAIWDLGKELQAGAYFTKGVYTAYTLPERTRLSMGGSWQASGKFHVLMEWTTTVRTGSSVVMAIKYSPAARLIFLSAWRIEPARWHIGFAWKMGNKTSAYGFSYDPALGDIHAVSFNWKKEEKP